MSRKPKTTDGAAETDGPAECHKPAGGQFAELEACIADAGGCDSAESVLAFQKRCAEAAERCIASCCEEFPDAEKAGLRAAAPSTFKGLAACRAKLSEAQADKAAQPRNAVGAGVAVSPVVWTFAFHFVRQLLDILEERFKPQA